MTKPTNKMTCPACGAAMNHHADKLISQSDLDTAAADPAIGGMIEEFHACPRCGNGASRHA